MGDIYAGIAVICALGGALFALGLRIGRAASRRTVWAFALLAVAALCVHSFVLLDNLRLAWFLPFSSLVAVGNGSPLAAGFLAGIGWGRIPRPIWRKCLTIVPLIAVCLFHAYGRLSGRPPRCSDVWDRGVSIQSSRSSCGAAAAATLLRAYGIAATEQEMAELCLTRNWGTCDHGIYRGLKLKTAGTPFRVEIVSGGIEQLQQDMDGPILVLVRLRRTATTGPRYEQDWGWEPGRGHAVVLFRFLRRGLVEMGDPSAGREKWAAEDLRVLWRGVGIRLRRE